MSSWVLFITTYPSSKFSVGFNVQLAVLLVKNGVVLLRQRGAAICLAGKRGHRLQAKWKSHRALQQ